jgi:hypothetical protein
MDVWWSCQDFRLVGLFTDYVIWANGVSGLDLVDELMEDGLG